MYEDKTTGKPLTLNGEPIDIDKIVPRWKKAKEEQSKRTKNKAEVFTPTWIVCQMLNYIDDNCLYPNAFNVMDGKTWEPTEHIEFKGDEWKDYVLQNRIEITCGEAPFIVTRYDPVTGEPIPIKNRVGFLDRKLRVVLENNGGYEWIKKAFQHTYGFDYQGDNVYLARCNLMDTFKDYWHGTHEQQEEIKNIINYNIWQMDGLTDKVPDTDMYAKIMDWDTGEFIEFRSLKNNDVKQG